MVAIQFEVPEEYLNCLERPGWGNGELQIVGVGHPRDCRWIGLGQWTEGLLEKTMHTGNIVIIDFGRNQMCPRAGTNGWDERVGSKNFRTSKKWLVCDVLGDLFLFKQQTVEN